MRPKRIQLERKRVQRTDTKQVSFPELKSDIESQSGESKDNGNQDKKS
ncbi:hypothetical protein ACP4OV_009941 [Aristida adscensionis]